MIRRKLVVIAAVMAGALALPGISGAAPPSQPPTKDSVTLAGQGVVTPWFSSIDFLNATSGPSGEAPTGHVSFTVRDVFPLSGPVTCLAVNGNRATLNFQSAYYIVTVQVTDDQPDTFDAEPTLRPPSDCSPLPPTPFGGPLSSGDITVVDAPPLPTTRAQCTNGGWKRFGFANQGLCVAFVTRHATK